jgi:SAM-dependent methyltransferase
MSDTYYQNVRPEVAAFLPASYTRVLEVGCGEGLFRRNLRPDCEYWGIEPFAPVAANAAGRLDKVITGTFDDAFAQLPDGYFDLVICNDVIEHMVDHDAFLARIKTKMAPGARIAGSIPNVRYFPNMMALLLRKDWMYVDAGILDRTHLRFFTEKSLARTLTDNGYIVEKIHGINDIGFRPNSLANLVKLFLMCFIGRDTRFMQFGFCVKRAD